MQEKLPHATISFIESRTQDKKKKNHQRIGLTQKKKRQRRIIQY